VLAVAASTPGPPALYASWNGATDLARWRVLAGASATALQPFEVARPTGFETRLKAPRSAAFVAVEALSANGTVLSTSPAVPVPPAGSARRGPAG
jgi:hypothetical protein